MKLKELRTAAGMSQEELANKLGLAKETINNWEGGYTKPGKSRYVELAEIFRVPVDYLVGLTEEEELLLQCYRKMAQEEQSALITLVKKIGD